MKKSLLILGIIAFSLTSCKKEIETETEGTSVDSTVVQVDEHNAKNSLDYIGTYKGFLPCADCEGIETKLELNSDKTYEIKETYLGKGDGKPFESKGSFQFDSKNPSVIELDQAGDGRKYFVAEGYLKALDLEGNEITGELADKYQLKKEPE